MGGPGHLGRTGRQDTAGGWDRVSQAVGTDLGSSRSKEPTSWPEDLYDGCLKQCSRSREGHVLVTFAVSDMKRKPCVFPEPAERGGLGRPRAQGQPRGGSSTGEGRVAAGVTWSLARDRTGTLSHITLAVTWNCLCSAPLCHTGFRARVSLTRAWVRGFPLCADGSLLSAATGSCCPITFLLAWTPLLPPCSAADPGGVAWRDVWAAGGPVWAAA